MPIRVTIFDDNYQRRDALEMLIDSTDNMLCAGTFDDCRHVVDRVTETQPDVVLMDINMPNVNGIEGLTLLRQAYPKLKVLMQTVFEDDDKVFACMCAGADGYILKQETPETLINAITDVMTGGAPMTPVIARKVLQLFVHRQKETSNSFDLTKRETEILGLLVKGFSYKMIASECYISYPTVNTHISNIYAKLKVESATGAVAMALKAGLV